MSSCIKLWWHENEGIFNFGDELNPYLVGKISNKPIERIVKIPKFSFYKVNICIGSVINIAKWNCNVWGAGIIERNAIIHRSNFYAVRGPITQSRMLELGLKPPKAIGDPAILLPLYYEPKAKKRYKFGFIPHIIDLDYFKHKLLLPDTIIINFTKPNIEAIINDICSCEIIYSSSLHGLIVAHAYGIPCVWMQTKNKLFGDNIKFIDYFLSVGLSDNISAIDMSEIDFQNMEKLSNIKNKIAHKVNEKILLQRQTELLDACPFK